MGLNLANTGWIFGLQCAAGKITDLAQRSPHRFELIVFAQEQMTMSDKLPYQLPIARTFRSLMDAFAQNMTRYRAPNCRQILRRWLGQIEPEK